MAVPDTAPVSACKPVGISTASTGTADWAGDWTEIGDDGKPDGGDIKIDKDAPAIKEHHNAIWRALDLSDATPATLSFVQAR